MVFQSVSVFALWPDGLYYGAVRLGRGDQFELARETLAGFGNVVVDCAAAIDRVAGIQFYIPPT